MSEADLAKYDKQVMARIDEYFKDTGASEGATMSEIREKIMALEAPKQFNGYERFGFNYGVGQAAAIVAMESEAEVQRLEAQVSESEKVNFHLASWQCPFTDGKKGLVNAENGDQYCEMERKVHRMEAMVLELEELLRKIVGCVCTDDFGDLCLTTDAYAVVREAERVIGGE